MALRIVCDSCGKYKPTGITNNQAVLPKYWAEVTISWIGEDGSDQIKKVLCSLCAKDITLGNLKPKFS